MPPPDAVQPTREARAELLDWSRFLREYEAKRNAGDPGPVLARRLNGAEYNHTIRDLTGVDIRPARHFPVDPANQEGFDNSGESLTMTPGLLMKYFDAARMVSEYLVLKPDGLDFAPHPVVVDTDRDKYGVRRIVDFYEVQNTDYSDYFYAAWRLRQLGGSDNPPTALGAVAEDVGVSQKYLGTVWSLLSGSQHHDGPIATLRSMWLALPDGNDRLDQVRSGCEEMSAFVERLRPRLSHSFDHLSHAGINNGTQPFVLWRNRQYAAQRRSLNRDALHVAQSNPVVEPDGETDDDEMERLLTIPADQEVQSRHVAALREFCDIFPDAFFVKSRGRDYKGLEKQGAQLADEAAVRLLSAGFHSQMGFFRDDAPLYDPMLDASEQRRLDTLWHDLDFVADVSRRQHQGYIWYERGESRFLTDPEFDFARGEDEDITSESKIKRLADVYLAKAQRTGASDQVLEAIRQHFLQVSSKIRRIELARLSAERTSPVQRGYWVVRQLLGERIPPPPPDVPELPQDESKLGELSLVRILAVHREHQNCAGCHNRFDALGVALEEFGPIGEFREVDLGGRNIEARAQMPDGIERYGVAGLQSYIREHRQQEFVDNACRKLLSYALGRTLIVADDVALEAMRRQPERSNHGMVDLIETVVTSPPFLNQRGRSYRYEELAE